MYKKVMLVLALLVIASLMIVGCNGNDQANNNADNNEPMGNNDNDTAGNNDNDGDDVVETDVPEPTEPPEPPTTRHGGWLDSVSMSVVTADTAVTQIEAGAIDIYASNLSTPADFEAIREAGLLRSYQFGLYYDITFNPAGPEFAVTGGFNPFSNAKIREAMNWLIDRENISQEIYGGTAIPKFFSIVSGFPDYARYVDVIRGIEAKYAYDFDKAEGIITAEMEDMGAVKNADGLWTYNDEVVDLIFLIRNDSDGTRVPQGDYVSNQLESIGFTVTRDYRTSSEASPLWVLGNMDDGLWHLYTGAWDSCAVSRDDGGDFQFFYTQQSGYAFSDLWQRYEITDSFFECSEALANNTFSTLDERGEYFKACLTEVNDFAFRIWTVDGKGASTWKQGLEVAYDLSAGVDINTLWPWTLRYTGEEGGHVNWADPDLFVDPANPVAGSNWTYDSQWQIAVSDWDAIPNPHTGLTMPQRLESAEVYIEEGLPVGATLDWVTLEFVAQNDVPADAWVDWDPVSETFITVGEMYPDGVTAKRKAVYHYGPEIWDVTWHDGTPLSMADFVMGMIYTFAPGSEGSSIYDESQAAPLTSFKDTFRGFKIVSEDPLVFELYSDTYYLDAEFNAVPYRTAFWPEYGYGQAPWYMMAVATKAEVAQTLAFSAAKSDLLEVEWMNFIAGPSLEILDGHLDEAIAEGYIPFEATLGDFITADQAATAYANLKAWYGDHGHFWTGTGPYFLDEVYPVEKTLTLLHNPNHVDLSDKFAGFAEPKLAELTVEGAGLVTSGAEAAFDVYVDFGGAPYPSNEVAQIKYLLFDATGEIVEVGAGVEAGEGYYTITLSSDTTGALSAGSTKMEVIAVVIPVSIPSMTSFEFVVE